MIKTKTAAENGLVALRQRAMRVLAESATGEIADRVSLLSLPAFDELRSPENGLVMTRGRIGGDGAPFNLGEATVTRAAVRLGSGEVGFAYVLGRDKKKARLIALCDALVQSAQQASVVDHVVTPLEQARDERRRRDAAQTAATKVDFFTLVRGEG